MQRSDAEQDDQSIADAAKNFNRLEHVLLQNRTLTLFGEINQDVARRMAEKLLALAFESDDPITLYIGSPGGHVESGDTIFDLIRYIKPEVRIIGTGWVGSIATHIYLACLEKHFLDFENLCDFHLLIPAAHALPTGQT